MMHKFVQALRIRLESVQAHFDSASPPALFAAYLFFSVVMVVATAACGLGQFPVDDRTKGYFWELNWGLNHLVLIPLGLFCCALVIQDVKRQIARISNAHMAVDGQFRELSLKQLQDDWEKVRLGPVWFAVIASISFAASWGEWWLGSAGQMLGFVPSEPREMLGWTNGAIVNPAINKAANMALSFVAFTAQGFVVTFFCYTVGVVLVFAVWIYRYSGDQQRKIVPNVISEDVRRGFEVFEPLMFRLLCMALVFTLVAFSIRMQLIYNSSYSPAGTALAFVLQDMAAGVFASIKAVFQGQSPDLFQVSLVPVFGMGISCATMAILVSLVTIFPTLILSLLARDSRESLRTCLAQADCPPCSKRSVDRADCEKRLKHMDFWPMQYPRPLELLAYVVFAAFCFIFYKFTIVLFGVIAMRMVHVVYKALARTTAP